MNWLALILLAATLLAIIVVEIRYYKKLKENNKFLERRK